MDVSIENTMRCQTKRLTTKLFAKMIKILKETNKKLHHTSTGTQLVSKIEE